MTLISRLMQHPVPTEVVIGYNLPIVIALRFPKHPSLPCLPPCFARGIMTEGALVNMCHSSFANLAGISTTKYCCKQPGSIVFTVNGDKQCEVFENTALRARFAGL